MCLTKFISASDIIRMCHQLLNYPSISFAVKNPVGKLDKAVFNGTCNGPVAILKKGTFVMINFTFESSKFFCLFVFYECFIVFIHYQCLKTEIGHHVITFVMYRLSS